MAAPAPLTTAPPAELATLESIARRVLWLAVRIVDYANRERPKGDPLKVGGHQASSASMVGLMTRLRDFGRLQSYPSRTKDPFAVDYSTGSVGLGSAAPLFGALADRYVENHFGVSTGGRFISLLGDAELDEGNIWEAVMEPLTRRLARALWIVDLNRQSLDRVVPGIRASELEQHFRAAGWNVVELKYGRRL